MEGWACCVRCLLRGILVRGSHGHHIYYENNNGPKVYLCIGCHIAITALNTAIARIAGYVKLSKEVRYYLLVLFMAQDEIMTPQAWEDGIRTSLLLMDQIKNEIPLAEFRNMLLMSCERTMLRFSKPVSTSVN